MRRAAALGVALVGAAALGVGLWLARQPRPLAPPGLLLRALAIDASQLATDLYDPYRVDGPDCNCSSDWAYRCDSPGSAYYDRVRADPRLRPVLMDSPQRLEDFVSYREFLRDRFTHGPHSRERSDPARVTGFNLLEMLDEADRGEHFLCGNISKMLVQMVHASGGFARTVHLNDPQGHGHSVVEAWIPALGRWVVLDPDNDILFRDASGRPLDALEIHRAVVSKAGGSISIQRGDSSHALYRPEMHDEILAYYHSVAWNRRADWVDQPYPYWHPRRHPKTNLTLWDGPRPRRPEIYVADVTHDADEVYFEPCRSALPDPR
jgi:hypothetical protein